MVHGSQFTGIGAAEIAALSLGWQNLFCGDIDSWVRDRLKQNFPNTIIHWDITETCFKQYNGMVDVFSGGFPCQDISIAGFQLGLQGKRSGLFFEKIRATDEIRPKYAVWENVSRVRKYLPTIIRAYAQIGYCLSWYTIHASWLGFPHQRERVFGVAFDTNRFGWAEIQHVSRNIEEAIYQASRWQSGRATCRQIQLENYSEFLRFDDGLPIELAQNEITAYGNAIVPYVIYLIYKCLNDFENENNY